MASRNGRPEQQLKKRVERNTDLGVAIIVGLTIVACGITNGVVLVVAPAAARPPVPEFVFGGLLIVLSPTLIEFIRGGKS